MTRAFAMEVRFAKLAAGLEQPRVLQGHSNSVWVSPVAQQLHRSRAGRPNGTAVGVLRPLVLLSAPLHPLSLLPLPSLILFILHIRPLSPPSWCLS